MMTSRRHKPRSLRLSNRGAWPFQVLTAAMLLDFIVLMGTKFADKSNTATIKEKKFQGKKCQIALLQSIFRHKRQDKNARKRVSSETQTIQLSLGGGGRK